VPGDPSNPGAGDANNVSILIACRVSGDPKLLPDDLKFRNIGDAKIPQGTRVVWQIKETGEHGSFFVPLDLQPGDEVPDLAALAAGIPKTNHCFSNIA
jgi:hypothetical protein